MRERHPWTHAPMHTQARSRLCTAHGARRVWAEASAAGRGTGEPPGAARDGAGAAGRGGDGRGGQGGGGRARPLPGVGGSAPPSAGRHRSPEPAARPRREASPGSRLGLRTRSGRRAGPRCRPGGRRATRGCPGRLPPGLLPCPRRRSISSGTGPALTPQTQHIAGPARWVPGPGLGRKGSESTACVPISQLRPPRPARDRSLRTREGTGRARRQLGCAPFPGRSGAALGHGMAFRPRAGVRRGPGPSRGPEAANAPQPPPRGAARRLGAFPPASELGPAGRVPGFLGRRPPPRSRRNKSDSSAWSCGRAGREGAERSGIPERALRPPPGTQRGRGAGGWLRGRSPRS